MQLKDKVVAITGGSRGLGKSMAILFQKEGAKVAICSLNPNEVSKTANELGILGVCADVSKEDELNNFKEEIIKNYGDIDIWINNAGVWMDGLLENSDMDKAHKMFDINLMGTINGTRSILSLMKNKNSGTIINIISQAGLYGRANYSLYAASKWAVNGFTKSIRLENADQGLSFIAIYPGGIKTDIFGGEKLIGYENFMDVDKVALKIINNLKQDIPEEELSITKETL